MTVYGVGVVLTNRPIAITSTLLHDLGLKLSVTVRDEQAA